MHRILRQSLVVTLFLAVVGAGMVGRPSSAMAGCCGEVAAINAAAAAELTAKTAQTVAIGKFILSLKPFTYQLPKPTDPVAAALYAAEAAKFAGTANSLGRDSLVDYYENVFWPRWIAMEQKKGQEAAKTNAANTHTGVQATDASNFVNYTQDLSRQRATAAVDTADRTSVVCPTATMAGALNALDPVVNLRTYMALKEATEEMDGSSRFPASANGLVNFYNEMIKMRNDLGVCDPEGNNKVNAPWCTNSKPNILNADINSMATDVALSANATDTENPNSKKFADMHLRNLFGFAFTPLRMDQVQGGKSNQINEILYDRVRFSSQVMTFRKPFQKNVESRQAVQGLDPNIQKAYEESLKLIGVQPGAEVEKLFKSPDGGWSKLAMEKVFFRDVNADPSEYARLAGQSALNLGNIMTYQTLKTMHSVVMLYDIREELKETNRLLGALGSLLAVDRHQRIESKIQGVAAN